MIVINIDKAKTVAHNKRREARAVEFTPLDIKATIPSEAAKAEAEREVIRQKYAAMQVAMDNASSIEELKSLLP